jgi:hypothetical protein
LALEASGRSERSKGNILLTSSVTESRINNFCIRGHRCKRSRSPTPIYKGQLWQVLSSVKVFSKESEWIMPESKNDERKEKREKYTCPCGFSSYDLMEFLQHPFMGNTIERDEEALKKLKEEEKE